MNRRSALASSPIAMVTVAATCGLVFTGGFASASEASTLATTTGCGKAPTIASGTHTIRSGGQNRGYILRVPDNYDKSHAYRLIFSFHWVGGGGAMSYAIACARPTGSADPYAPGAKSWTRQVVWNFITQLGSSASPTAAHPIA